MKHPIRLAAATVVTGAALLAAPRQAHAQKLHVNPRWKECSFQLDASLTQQAFRQFTREAVLVTYYRPLTDARPLGRGTFEISILQWKTGIDDNDAAWNDTFVHPDSTHVFFESNGLEFPGLTVRAGITDRTDASASTSRRVPAATMDSSASSSSDRSLAARPPSAWSTATRVSVVSLYGPDDLSLAVGGVDLVGSRRIALTRRIAVSPYAGLSGYLSRAH